MEQQTLVYTNATKPISRFYPNPPPLSQNQEILVQESSNKEKGSGFSSLTIDPSHGFARTGSMASLMSKNAEEDDVEDEESEFKMGRLIRQASLNSSHMPTPQKTIKARNSSLRRYLSLKPEPNQEKIIDMRKVESMKERRSRTSMKTGGGGGDGCGGGGVGGDTPTIPRVWDDKGLSENMKLQIKFWARAVASNVHEEC